MASRGLFLAFLLLVEFKNLLHHKKDHAKEWFIFLLFFFHMYLFNSINTHLHLQYLPGSGRSDNIIIKNNNITILT